MMFERVLRTAALIIAVLALIDPTLTLASRQRPVVAVSIVESPTLASAMSGTETGADRARRVRTEVEAALAEGFDVREGPAPDAAAQVLIGDGSFPTATPLVEGAPVFAVAIDDTPSPNVRVLRVEAPAQAQLTSRLRVVATLEARALAGRTSTIVLRADDLELARVTRAWTQSPETATIAFEAMPFRTGLTRLTVAAEPLPTEATTADNSVDTATDITNDKIPVLVVDARPSWMTRFARQALDGDERFAIKTLSRVSRGLTSATPETPQSLTAATLDPFAIVIVGAPDALTRPDVDALREFTRVRGGLLVFAPDQQPAGPYTDLLPVHGFEEKVQEEPTAAGGFNAAEFALPRELLPGAEVLGRAGNTRTGPPVIVSSPAGDGEVLFIGALDAWRYRNAARDSGAAQDTNAVHGSKSDRDGTGFDATWRQLLATHGSRVPPPIAVSLDTPIVAPGARVDLHVRLRRTLLQPDGALPPLTARLRQPGPNDGGQPNGVSQTDSAETLRLWPSDQPGGLTSTLNAPSRPGVYAVSVGVDRSANSGQARLLVVSPAPVAAVTWDGLRTFADAHGGLVVTSADIPRLIAQLHQRVPASALPRARHPFRSAWWMAPFAACLGGEWWLRRRRGQR